jgi:AcrR family transcriptional regulator
LRHLERKQREKQQIKDRILFAALDIAKAEGWEGVTIRRIADAVEYTTSIVYGHFESKEDLLEQLADKGFEQLYEQLEKVIAKENDPAMQLLELSMINWKFAAANKALYELMFTTKRPTGQNAAKGMDLVRSIFVKLTGKQDVSAYVLNWLCLRRGCIDLLLQNRQSHKASGLSVKPDKLYMEFMTRFIESISFEKGN